MEGAVCTKYLLAKFIIMSTLYCDSPVIILNPNFRYLLLKYGVYCLGDSVVRSLDSSARSKYVFDFPYSIYSKYRTGVTVDTLDSYYIIDPYTSETFPMYILVPCGRCLLCRSKKANEWAFRAVCENKTSTSEPLFVTLTYNSQNLPSDGISKIALQLFMKRLRRSLDRLGIDHNLRYFAVGEYGTKSARPHYHLILWNFPNMRTMSERLRLVEKSWLLGFSYCVPCRSGAISYVMKYMRKTPTVPVGSNPNFFLSSRKDGGIGAKYAKSLMSFYRANPSQLDISVTDPYSGKTFTQLLPTYFKNLYFPANSRIVKKEVTDAYKSLQYRIMMRSTYRSLLPNMSHFSILLSHEITLLKRFSFLPTYVRCYPDELLRRTLSKHDSGYILKLYDDNEDCIDNLCDFLNTVDYDRSYIAKRKRILSLRQSALTDRFVKSPLIDVQSVKLSLISRNDLAISREKL